MAQSRRAMIECIFGWGKQHGAIRKTKHRVICRATKATAHVLTTERKAADCILVMEVAGSRYLPSQVHTKDRI
jgi:hypothetical protein